MIISNATAKNWERLSSRISHRLRRGANKTLSVRRIYPREYITKEETFSFLEQVLFICSRNQVPLESAVYSLAIKILDKAGICRKDNVKTVLRSYTYRFNREIYDLAIPSGEKDILGIVYQTLLTEGEKNTRGSYYTPFDVVAEMLANINLGDQLFLDPCCGSGAFLLSLSPNTPEQLWGCDCDALAVMIAKVNLLCKYPDSDFIPHIFCCDYLAESDFFSGNTELFRQKFGCIATNPPWGAKTEGTPHSGYDSFSNFFMKAYSQLQDNGKIIFLFPESVLNIKTHLKMREYLLTETHLNSISCIEKSFSGVMTKYVALDADKKKTDSSFLIRKGNNILQKNIPDILGTKDKIISFSNGKDTEIIDALLSVKAYDLSGSIFALGIVTGNNKEKIKQTPLSGMEPIYTGKEIGKYNLKPPKNYILYDRNSFQQTAKDEYYRAPEKLVYKFISKQMLFSYDCSQSLFLNSANILIPKIPGYGIKTVLAFLNSDLLRFFYFKSFHDIKILKNNLMQLPFPKITEEVNDKIENLVNQILLGNRNNCQEEYIQQIIFDCYKLKDSQITYIRRSLYGIAE